MFRRIEIQLTGPICSCEKQALAWSLSIDSRGKHCLKILCTGCNTILEAPHEKFVASFKLDTPYPGEKTQAKPAPKLTIMDGGKVLPFIRPTVEQSEEPKDSA